MARIRGRFSGVYLKFICQSFGVRTKAGSKASSVFMEVQVQCASFSNSSLNRLIGVSIVRQFTAEEFHGALTEIPKHIE